MGLNVNMTSEALGAINKPATSLLQETGVAYDRGALLSTLASHFSADLALFKQQGFTPFAPLLNNLLLRPH